MIPIAKPLIGKEEEKAVIEVLRSGMLSQGKKVQEFEENFAKYCGTKYAIATDNGTSALIVALLAAGVGPGDEVITTPFTFIATGNSIVFTGAKPVFVDIDPETYNIDPERIESSITKRTKAIMPVHLYGLMANMEKINKIAKKYNLIVIEDAAQAHGADINGRKAGSWGLAGTFSFYPTKNMTTGEGGMITTNDLKLLKKARLLRNQGMDKRYYHGMVGYNFRMTDMEAAIGIEQLKKLEGFTKRRIKNSTYLIKEFSNVKEVQPPKVPEGFRHVFHQYTVQSSNRREIENKLSNGGIGYGIYYPVPIHKQKAFSNFKNNSNLKISENVSKKVISLPVHPGVAKEGLEKIIDVML